MSEQRFCTACGKPLTPGNRFCSACGTAVAAATPKQEVAEAVAEPVSEPAYERPVPALSQLPAGEGATEPAGTAKTPGGGSSMGRRIAWYVGLPVAAVAGVFVGLALVSGGGNDIQPAIALPLGEGGGTPATAPTRAGATPATTATSPTQRANATRETRATGSTVPATVQGAATNAPAPAAVATAAATVIPATAVPPTAAPAPTQAPTATPIPAAPNLLTQGGFENGSLSAPWGTGIYEPNAGGIFWGSANATAQVTTGNVRGTYALRIVNNSAAAPNVYRTLSRKVNVVGGTQYCFTVWVRTENGSAGMLSFRFNDSWSQALGTGAGTAAWSQYAYTFAAEDSNIDVRIVSENTGTAWVDDLELTAGACKVANGRITAGSPR